MARIRGTRIRVSLGYRASRVGRISPEALSCTRGGRRPAVRDQNSGRRQLKWCRTVRATVSVPIEETSARQSEKMRLAPRLRRASGQTPQRHHRNRPVHSSEQCPEQRTLPLEPAGRAHRHGDDRGQDEAAGAGGGQQTGSRGAPPKDEPVREDEGSEPHRGGRRRRLGVTGQAQGLVGCEARGGGGRPGGGKGRGASGPPTRPAGAAAATGRAAIPPRTPPPATAPTTASPTTLPSASCAAPPTR